jgi:chemotaxis protein methyltransferase CheR
MSINTVEFNYIRSLLREQAAIGLEPGKEYLVESRLNQLAKREGLKSVKELLQRLRVDSTGYFQRKVVEAMVTTETTFFRDPRLFEILKTVVIPSLIVHRDRERSLNFWCAASSRGQEPYSVVMVLREHFPSLSQWEINFIASDISNEMLAYARDGIYSQHEVSRGLPARLLVKYFKKVGQHWRIREDIREMVEFRQINLAKFWAPLPKMDIILMRNVLIYFDIDMRTAVLERVRRLLRPDGYLFLGGSESTINFVGAFEPIEHDVAGCFRLKAV